jgi:hypothetical protein
MIFAEDDAGPPLPADSAGKPEVSGDDPGPKPSSPTDSRRARFKVVK